MTTGHLPTAIREAVSRWDPDRQDEWSERAALIQYGDNVLRDQAEQRAFFELRKPIASKAKRAA